jgi:formate/nitrite transporter FocA (FNT family)
VLVCLAVWLAMAGRSVTDKILAVIFPISAFVAAGFEHSVANMYFLSVGSLLEGAVVGEGLLRNLVPVTLGNIAGGGVMVALVYFIVYRLQPARKPG